MGIPVRAFPERTNLREKTCPGVSGTISLEEGWEGRKGKQREPVEFQLSLLSGFS